jgi:hypothetical protein
MWNESERGLSFTQSQVRVCLSVCDRGGGEKETEMGERETERQRDRETERQRERERERERERYCLMSLKASTLEIN